MLHNYKVRCSVCRKNYFIPMNGLQVKCEICKGKCSFELNSDNDIMREIAKDIMPDVFAGKIESIGER